MYKPIKISEIPSRSQREGGAIEAEIRDFLDTSYAAAEITIPAGKTAKLLAQAYSRVIRNNNFPVKVMQRGERLFMAKEKALK